VPSLDSSISRYRQQFFFKTVKKDVEPAAKANGH
jgi:hypothetical protein